LFRVDKVTLEDEEEMIRKAADKIQEYGMDAAAVLFLQSYKPLTYVGGQMGRFMIFPFFYMLGGNITQEAEKFFMVFENRDNVEKLIQLLEKRSIEKDSDKARKREELKNANQKLGWRRFLPF
jgi:hypothetical protein